MANLNRKYAGASNFERVNLDDYDLECADYKTFKDELNELRKPEDNVRYRLVRVERRVRDDEQVDCQSVWDNIMRLREFRKQGINRCLAELTSSAESGDYFTKMNLSFYRTEDRYEATSLRETVKHFKQYCGASKKHPWNNLQ